MPDSEPRNTENWAQASERLRDLTKWIIASFGGIAVAFTAGVQITQIRDLQEPGKVVLSFVGLAIVLVGALVAIASSVRVMSAGTVSLKDLDAVVYTKQTRPRGITSALAPPYGTEKTWREVRRNTERYFAPYREDEEQTLVAELKERLEHRYREYVSLRMDLIAMENAISDDSTRQFVGFKAIWTAEADRRRVLQRLQEPFDRKGGPDTTGNPSWRSLANPFSWRGRTKSSATTESGGEEVDRSALVALGEQVLRNAAGEYRRVEDMSNLVVKFASAELVRLEFRRSLKFLALGALLTAIGIGLFVWAAYASGTKPPT